MSIITLGPSGGNECCICCSTGCQPGPPSGRCCTCPPTGNLLICFPDPGCCDSYYTGIEITLVPTVGACSGTRFGDIHGPICEHNQSVPYEEWSTVGSNAILLCSGDQGPDCGGECVRIDFCCCNEQQSGAVPSGNCSCSNYLLGWTHVDDCYGDDGEGNPIYCSCPTGTVETPIDPDVSMGPAAGQFCQCMDNVTGSSPFFYKFQLSFDAYECDCCVNPVCFDITGIIVEDAMYCGTV